MSETFDELRKLVGFKVCGVCSLNFPGRDGEKLCPECVKFKREADEQRRVAARRRHFRIW